MNRRLDESARRKDGLIARCAGERDEVSAAVRRIKSRFALGSVVSGLTYSLKAYPLVAAGISTLPASGYAGPVLRTAGKGFRLWRLALPLWGLWKKKG